MTGLIVDVVETLMALLLVVGGYVAGRGIYSVNKATRQKKDRALHAAYLEDAGRHHTTSAGI